MKNMLTILTRLRQPAPPAGDQAPVAVPTAVPAPAAVAAPAADDTGQPLIDATTRSRELSDADLLAGADEYFVRLNPDSVQYKKPFSDPPDAQHLTRGLGQLFQAASLFRGARVLDFGCATGWLTLGLAQMGCDAIGVDIAPSAVKLAERLRRTRHVPSDGPLEFKVYNGGKLPVPDASLDRILCFDSFHHVRDQAATLAEFARALKQGGRAAFVEPGPDHSRTAKSQDEMRRFQVLENDVDMRVIAEHAAAVGFSAPRMLVQLPHSVELPGNDFQQWVDGGIPDQAAAELLALLKLHLTNTQVFYLVKGEARHDSRMADHLGGELSLRSLRRQRPGAKAVVATITVRNTGAAHWITRVPGNGQVKLGCRLMDAKGDVLTLDLFRTELPRAMPPGDELDVDVRFELPDLPAYSFEFDLVAEFVTWFAQAGKLKPLVITSAQLRALP